MLLVWFRSQINCEQQELSDVFLCGKHRFTMYARINMRLGDLDRHSSVCVGRPLVVTDRR